VLDPTVEAKFEEVKRRLRGHGVLVAFSGGVDSAVLALLAKESAARTALLTVDSVLLSRGEVSAARKTAEELGLPIEVVSVDELGSPGVAENPVTRCYFCKKELSRVWLDKARELGLDLVVDGTNASDARGHRPGAKALTEAGVVSPFREANITKDEIRAYARHRGLSVADRPSMACLASRFPYGTRITEERVRMVDEVEHTVRRLFDVQCVRARFHGDVVRIEVGRDEMTKMFDQSRLEQLAKHAKSVGFKYVALDVEGYRTGAMDEVLSR